MSANAEGCKMALWCMR